MVGLTQMSFAQNFSSSNNSSVKVTATVKWMKKSHDFGEIQQKKPVTVVFKVKNKGISPFQIYNVESTCGCTIPSYPKQPIKLGETAEITATFDAKNAGAFFKTIKVSSNASKKPVELRLRGTVVQ